jgi:hypothetical protein
LAKTGPFDWHDTWLIVIKHAILGYLSFILALSAVGADYDQGEDHEQAECDAKIEGGTEVHA